MHKLIAHLTNDASVRIMLPLLHSPVLKDQIDPSGPGKL
jgi:hypothetical protein